MSKCYVIANLNLYEEKQMEALQANSFESMNDYIIKNWNRTIKDPDDVILVMGKIGVGSLEEMKNIIGKLNGVKVLMDADSNPNFSREEWREIGFNHCWDVGFCQNEGDDFIIYVNYNQKVDKHMEAALYLVSNPDSCGKRKNTLNPDALKWWYNPIAMDSVLSIYNNLKAFEQLPDSTETRSDVKELDWGGDGE